mmetsp:Transcript_76176/g.119011  ORF Transcript_76176/g.119011 Transcript_76176/m.119011 type:complete len:204 (-) Transcript_76176:627-1238(-)
MRSKVDQDLAPAAFAAEVHPWASERAFAASSGASCRALGLLASCQAYLLFPSSPSFEDYLSSASFGDSSADHPSASSASSVDSSVVLPSFPSLMEACLPSAALVLYPFLLPSWVHLCPSSVDRPCPSYPSLDLPSPSPCPSAVPSSVILLCRIPCPSCPDSFLLVHLCPFQAWRRQCSGFANGQPELLFSQPNPRTKAYPSQL